MSILEFLREKFPNLVLSNLGYRSEYIDEENIYEKFSCFINGSLIRIRYQSKFGELEIDTSDNKTSRKFLIELTKVLSTFMGEEPYMTFDGEVDELYDRIRPTVVWATKEITDEEGYKVNFQQKVVKDNVQIFDNAYRK